MAKLVPGRNGWGIMNRFEKGDVRLNRKLMDTRDYKKGSLYSLETLLTRAHGKPKETQQVTNDGFIEVVFTKGKTIL